MNLDFTPRTVARHLLDRSYTCIVNLELRQLVIPGHLHHVLMIKYRN